jgi:L-rhamnose mutarotase
MFHIFLTMRLKPGCLEAYRKAHDSLWPEIDRSMRDNEVSMAIYHEEGRLSIIAIAPSEAHWERSRQEPALARWDKRMTEFLEAREPGKIDFRQPEKVFGFGKFAKDKL